MPRAGCVDSPMSWHIPSTSGPWCAARPRPASPSSDSSTSTSTRSPDALLGALRGQLLDERGDPLDALGDSTSSGSACPGAPRPRCRPRRSSRTRRRRRAGPRSRKRSSSSTSSSVSPGKPTMTLLRIARRRAPARGCARSGRGTPRRPPKRRIRRSTVGAGVLEGQVEVRRDARRRRDRLRAGRAASRPAAGRDPDPLDARRRAASSGSSVSSSRRSPRSLPYDVEFSLTRNELADALVGEPARLGEDVAGRPGDERAAEGRDRAERAAPVAAAGDLQRCPRAAVEPRRRTRGGPAGRRQSTGRTSWPGTATPMRPRRALRPGVSGSSVRRSVGDVRPPAARPPRMRRRWLDDVGVVVEAEHGVGLGQLVGELVAVALGQAADGDDRRGSRRAP